MTPLLHRRSARAADRGGRGFGRRAFIAGLGGVVLGPLGIAACASAPKSGDGTIPTTRVSGASEKPAVAALAGLTDFGGQPLRPPRLVGSVAVVDFWASWCAPCRQAFRHLDQLYRTYVGRGLTMLAVSVDDDAAAARRFWAAARPRFPVAWDAEGQVRARFSVFNLPTTLLFDPEGFLVQRNEGFDPVDHRLLMEQVHRLLR